ncbi:MAG: hypothetical protein ACRDNS_17125 [Trebonia sp.]
MPEEVNQEFIDSYTSLLIASWTKEEERARLLADPAAYAAMKGLPVGQGAIVRVDESAHDGLFTPQELMAAWSETPGTHVLLVPATPVIDLDELDEADLEAIAAGKLNVNVNVGAVAAAVLLA